MTPYLETTITYAKMVVHGDKYCVEKCKATTKNYSQQQEIPSHYNILCRNLW